MAAEEAAIDGELVEDGELIPGEFGETVAP